MGSCGLKIISILQLGPGRARGGEGREGEREREMMVLIAGEAFAKGDRGSL